MEKLKYIIFTILILLYSCNQVKQESINNSAKKNTEIITKDVEKTNSKEKKASAKTLPELFSMNSFIGKYPTQINLFEKEILANRLKQIDKFDFDKMILNWNTETPISIENQIIHASGCKAHNCPSNGYELFIDLKNDNINIYYFRDNTLKVYTEKEWIDLPKGFNNEIEIKKDNAKIGSLSDDMKSTYNITPTYSPLNSKKEIEKPKTELKKVEKTPKVKTNTKEFKTKTGKIFIVTEEKQSASISKITVTPKGFTEVNRELKMEKSDPFDYALVTDINNDGFDELYIITRGAGSGSYANIYGFASNKDKSVTPIYVPELSDDDFIRFFPNYMGHDTFYIENNKLMRKYKQFKKEDEQCCPTGGMMFLEYQLKMGEASWVLKITK